MRAAAFSSAAVTAGLALARDFERQHRRRHRQVVVDAVGHLAQQQRVFPLRGDRALERAPQRLGDESEPRREHAEHHDRQRRYRGNEVAQREIRRHRRERGRVIAAAAGEGDGAEDDAEHHTEQAGQSGIGGVPRLRRAQHSHDDRGQAIAGGERQVTGRQPVENLVHGPTVVAVRTRVRTPR